MELQLSLSLSINSSNPIETIDFIKNKGFEPVGDDREVITKTWRSSTDGTDRDSYNKRGFNEAFGKIQDASSQTLPLVLWSGDQPNDGDDWKGKEKSCSIIEKDDEDQGEHVVGWPPLKSWRKKMLHHQHQHGHIGNNRMAVGNEERGLISSTNYPMYVKVKMEGVPIARKINLRLYQSYQALTSALISMFAKCQNVEKDVSQYTLAYQDKDGDWLIAGDVPWQTFITSVQRLEIIKNGG
ncbi:hypothetical protein Tsubulata_045965 [Turnera subulata]|uniref:Auxin-responsive protein n=1 Tax=Turnera subulata TaxID=218843 RepID=A0A9Q0IZH6_9ROSI|nr:hypothetical protein Tsubulata_045965 [Turnera subulata]